MKRLEVKSPDEPGSARTPDSRRWSPSVQDSCEVEYERRVASLEQLVRDQATLIKQIINVIPQLIPAAPQQSAARSSSLNNNEQRRQDDGSSMNGGSTNDDASSLQMGILQHRVGDVMQSGSIDAMAAPPAAASDRMTPSMFPCLFIPANTQTSSLRNAPNERSIQASSGLLEFAPLIQSGVGDALAGSRMVRGSKDFMQDLKLAQARRKTRSSFDFTAEDDELDKTVKTYNAEDTTILVIDAGYLLCTIVAVVVTVNGLSVNDLTEMPQTYTPVVLGLCQLIFGVWMYSRLFVRYKSSDWSVVDGYSRIKRHYWHTWFWADLFLTFPLEFIFLGWRCDAFRVLNARHFLRIIRAFQLGAASSNPLNISRESFYFCLLLALLLLVTHGSSSFFVNKACDVSSLSYVQGVFYVVGAFSTVGYQDITTTSRGAILFSLAVMLMGTVIIASTTAFVTRYMTSKDKLEADMEMRRSMLHSALTYYDIPWEIQKEIIRVLPSLMEQENQQEFRQILGTLPGTVGRKLDHFLRSKLLRQMPLFREISSDALLQLSTALVAVHVNAQTSVIVKGDEGNEMFIIVHGVVEVVVPVDDEDLIVATLSDGQFFGEIALVQNIRRTASVVTVTDCDFFVLPKADFLVIAQRFVEFASVVEKEVDLRQSVLNSSQISGRQSNHLSERELSLLPAVEFHPKIGQPGESESAATSSEFAGDGPQPSNPFHFTP